VALSAGAGLFAFGVLWFALLRQLSVEWTVNSQYTYGWAVPVMCLVLGYWRWLDRPAPEPSSLGLGFGLGALGLAVFLFPTRIVQEANPDWRLVSWLCAVEVVGLTLVAVRAAGGPRALVHFTFPIGFILVAVPWPTLLEQPAIQALTRANAALTVEVLGQFGVPALQHGSLIEVSSGVVGIDEACSGIRSFQANLMIALFLGELYRFRWRSRVALVAAGFALAFLFNVARTTTLSAVAAKRGLAAISQWHDPAGVSILVACFVAVWLLALALRRFRVSASVSETTPLAAVASAPASPRPDWWPNRFPARSGGALLLLWLLGVELGTQLWYRPHEASLPAPQTWSVKFPRAAEDFRELPIADSARQYLRYTEAANASWRESGTRWQVIFLRWNPGRTAARLARAHTPDICLAAAGRKVRSLPDVHREQVGNLELPFQVFEVQEAAGMRYVFYCLWEDRAAGTPAESAALSFASRWQAVLERRRNLGQRSLEVVIGGVPNRGEAQAALHSGLRRLVAVPRN
jgi:exosortase